MRPYLQIWLKWYKSIWVSLVERDAGIKIHYQTTHWDVPEPYASTAAKRLPFTAEDKNHTKKWSLNATEELIVEMGPLQQLFHLHVITSVGCSTSLFPKVVLWWVLPGRVRETEKALGQHRSLWDKSKEAMFSWPLIKVIESVASTRCSRCVSSWPVIWAPLLNEYPQVARQVVKQPLPTVCSVCVCVCARTVFYVTLDSQEPVWH